MKICRLCGAQANDCIHYNKICLLHSRFFYLFIILYTLIETQGVRTFWRIFAIQILHVNRYNIPNYVFIQYVQSNNPIYEYV